MVSRHDRSKHRFVIRLERDFSRSIVLVGQRISPLPLAFDAAVPWRLVGYSPRASNYENDRPRFGEATRERRPAPLYFCTGRRQGSSTVGKFNVAPGSSLPVADLPMAANLSTGQFRSACRAASLRGVSELSSITCTAHSRAGCNRPFGSSLSSPTAISTILTLFRARGPHSRVHLLSSPQRGRTQRL
jgi:hypothetical protein